LPPPKRVNRTYLRDPLQIGGTIVGVTVVFGGIGWWIDTKLGSFPFGMIIGATIGLSGVIYLNYLWLQELDRENSESSDDAGPTDST
jgi:F0F1-type ATP synthase assembly protein I